MTGTRPLLLDAGPVALSALLAEPVGEPRGLLLALHGGGARARYWDSPVDPASSLLRLAATAGWLAVAVDRPGYGAAADYAARRPRAADQVPLIEAAVAGLCLPGLPVVLVGHSLGALVAVHAAAARLPVGLVGLAIGGIPLRYTDEQTARMATIDDSGPTVGRPGRGARPDPRNWFGPTGSWDERLLDHRGDLVTKTPSGEFFDAIHCPDLLPPVLAKVEVPVHVAVAEHEQTAAPGPEVLAAAVLALTAASWVETCTVRDSGHNLSLGRGARGYHLRVLAHAEDALRAAGQPLTRRD